MLRRKRLHAIEGKGKLEVHRLLGPQGGYCLLFDWVDWLPVESLDPSLEVSGGDAGRHVDVGRLVAHQAVRVGADVEPPDIIPQMIRMLGCLVDFACAIVLAPFVLLNCL
jgi:hypothetical protein